MQSGFSFLPFRGAFRNMSKSHHTKPQFFKRLHRIPTAAPRRWRGNRGEALITKHPHFCKRKNKPSAQKAQGGGIRIPPNSKKRSQGQKNAFKKTHDPLFGWVERSKARRKSDRPLSGRRPRWGHWRRLAQSRRAGSRSPYVVGARMIVAPPRAARAPSEKQNAEHKKSPTGGKPVRREIILLWFLRECRSRIH
jgi:hypothetical protein